MIGIREIFIVVLGVTIAAGFIWLVMMVIEENAIWNEFKIAHHCEIVAKEKGSVSTGVGVTASGNTGVITTTTPDKTAWLCDDGITYWR